MRSGVVLAVYCGWMAALTGAFYAFPGLRPAAWAALASSSAAAIVVGIVVHRPARALPWWLLAAAVSLYGVGDVIQHFLTGVFPSLADAFYLAAYPVSVVALVLLVRCRSGGRDQGSLLDALSLAVVSALLLWIFLIDPFVRADEDGVLQRATSIAYPVGDVLLLATVARLLIVAPRNRAVQLLGAGTAALLVSDVLFGLGRLDESWRSGAGGELGWAVCFLAWGAAGLHPAMARSARPAGGPAGALSLSRVALLMAASLIAPAALLLDSLDGTVEHGPVIAVLSAVFFLLVLLRVSGVVARYRRVLDRERALRSAGADLTAAADHDEVVAAVRRAVGRLFPSGCAQHTELCFTPSEARTCRLEPVGDATALECPLLLDEQRLGSLVVVADEGTLLDLRGAVEVLASQTALAVARIDLAHEVGRRNTEAYFRTLVHNAHDVILIVDADGVVGYASPSARTVLGPGSVVGTALLDLVDPDDRAAVAEALAGAEPSTRDYRAVRRDGVRIQVEVIHRDLRADPTVRGVVLTLRDVTEQRRLEEELTHRAFHDPLTGLANRVRFQNCVERALCGLAERPGPVGVLFVDLDDFKLVNDTSGHEAGDQLLVRLADRLQDVLGPDDLAARLGGDEFAVLVTDGDPERVAARVVGALSAPLDVAGGLQASVSVGVAITTEACGAAEMLRRADLALYAAKGAGKGRWRRYEPHLHQAAVDRVEVRTELRRALDTDQLELFYQPIVDLTDGRMVGVEALVRWRHPRRGLVRPAEFIPAAEETGLIVPLGRWALDRALTDLARWHRLAPQQPLSVSVNVSAREVCAPGFARRLLDALATRGLAGHRLVVEITETGLLTEHHKVADDLAQLRAHGVRIALDDFGTGYSSLDYVRRHAIDVLKIDRSFTAAVDRSARQAALVGAMIALARALGLAVVAEGIETVAQRDTVRLAGCELGQGYLFATPADAGQVTRWLRRGTFAGLSATAGAGPPEVLAGATPGDDS